MKLCNLFAALGSCATLASICSYVLYKKSYSFLLVSVFASFTGVFVILAIIIAAADRNAMVLAQQREQTAGQENCVNPGGATPVSFQVMIELDQVIKVGVPTEQRHNVVVIIDP